MPLIDELALGTLDAAQAGAVREHLRTCAACSEALALATALFADLDGLAADEVPLPDGLGVGFADRVLAQLPRLPGEADPLAGLKVRRPGRRLAAIVLGLSAGVMEALWLLAVWLLPAWVTDAVRLTAFAFWQGTVAVVGNALFALQLLAQIVVRLVLTTDPIVLVAVAFAAAAAAFVFAVASSHSRWDA